MSEKKKWLRADRSLYDLSGYTCVPVTGIEKVKPGTRLIEILLKYANYIYRHGPRYLSSTQNITLREIDGAYNMLPWNSSQICWRDDFEMWFVKKHSPEYWDRSSISNNISEKDYLENPDWDWDYCSLSRNSNLHVSIALGDMLKHAKNNWDLVSIIRCGKLTVDDVKTIIRGYPPRYVAKLAHNRNLSMEMINACPDYKWDFSDVVGNDVITFEEMMKNTHINWSRRMIAESAGVTTKWLVENGYAKSNDDIRLGRDDYDYECVWKPYVSSVPISDVEKYPDTYWDMHELSQNPKLTWEFIHKYPHWGWNYEGLCENPGLKDPVENIVSVHDHADRIGEFKMYYLGNPSLKPYEIWNMVCGEIEDSHDLNGVFDIITANMGNESWQLRHVKGMIIVRCVRRWILRAQKKRVGELERLGLPPGVVRIIVRLL